MKKLLISLMIVLVWVSLAFAARFYSVPGCAVTNVAPDGTPSCAITGSTAYTDFSAVTGGYSAYFDVNNSYGLSKINNSSFNHGSALQLNSGTKFGEGQARLCGNFANGSYYVSIYGTASGGGTTRDGSVIWIDTSPISPKNPDNAKSAVLAIPGVSNWTTGVIQTGYAFTGGNASPALFALNGNACIYVAPAQPAVFLEAMFLSQNILASPALPTAPPVAPQVGYEIQKIGSNVVTIDGVANEGIWSAGNGAPEVAFTGFSNSDNTALHVRLARSGATIYGFIKADGTIYAGGCGSTGRDYALFYQCPRLEFWLTDDQIPTNKYKFSVDINGNIYDCSGTCANATFNFANASAASVTGTNTWTGEFKFDLPFTPSDDSFGLGDFTAGDPSVSNLAQDQLAFCGDDGSFNVPSCWKGIKYSSVIVPTITNPDVTAPTVGTATVIAHSSTTLTIQATTSEPASCFVVYGPAGNHTQFTSSTTPSNAGVCSIQITGLTASTQYFFRMKATDPANNTGQSAEANSTTDATPPSNVAGFFPQTSAWLTPLTINDWNNHCATLGDCGEPTTTQVRDASYVGQPGGSIYKRTLFWHAQDGATKYAMHGVNSGLCARSGHPDWNDVPVLDGWLPNQQDNDRITVFYDSTYVWEMYQANNQWFSGSPAGVTNWGCSQMRRWDRTGTGNFSSGVFSPYDFQGSGSACTGSSAAYPLGTIRKSEIDAGRIPHAIAVSMVTAGYDNTRRYPCGGSAAADQDGQVTWINQDTTLPNGDVIPANQDLSHWFPRDGDRLMLDPAYNVDALNVPPALKVIYKAMQEFGIINVDGQSYGQYYIVSVEQPHCSPYPTDDEHPCFSWETDYGITTQYNFPKDLVLQMRRVRCINSQTTDPNGTTCASSGWPN